MSLFYSNINAMLEHIMLYIMEVDGLQIYHNFGFEHKLRTLNYSSRNTSLT